jgi:hypothetical protein
MSIATGTNVAAFIALQVVPTLIWGGTGVGKTTVLLALAKALNRYGHLLIGSTHLPEDFSGYPHADMTELVMKMMPTDWVRHFRDGNGFLILDEFTTVPDNTLAAELSLITEGRVGDETLPKSTIIVAAANPPNLAPGGKPLAPSMRSRFFHFEWQVDRNALYAGYRNGLEWGVPEFPKVPASHKELYPKYGSLVEAFLRGNPDCLEKIPDSDETLSFPNPRTWSYVVKVLSAAESVGFAVGSSVFAQLVTGCVGDASGGEFLAYMSRLDLVDPAAVLEGKLSYSYTNRPDLNICLLTGLVKELRSNTSSERWVRAAEVFCQIGEHEIESFLTQFRSLWNPVDAARDPGVRPAGWMPEQALLGRLMRLVPQGVH